MKEVKIGKDKISVALCTYNGEKFIREQLRSIVGQTILPWQIVVWMTNRPTVRWIL